MRNLCLNLHIGRKKRVELVHGTNYYLIVLFIIIICFMYQICVFFLENTLFNCDSNH